MASPYASLLAALGRLRGGGDVPDLNRPIYGNPLTPPVKSPLPLAPGGPGIVRGGGGGGMERGPVNLPPPTPPPIFGAPPSAGGGAGVIGGGGGGGVGRGLPISPGRGGPGMGGGGMGGGRPIFGNPNLPLPTPAPRPQPIMGAPNPMDMTRLQRRFQSFGTGFSGPTRGY
jgi:hypothetical protein